jgi:hypothetical protein
LREILTALYSHYNLDVKSHVKDDQNAEKTDRKLDDEQTTNKEDAHPEQNPDEKEGEEDLDIGEELKEGDHLNSTQISEMSVPDLQLPEVISPIKSPPKQPKQKQSKKRKRKDYNMLDSFTPIAVRKHKRH